ncbi:MAG: glycosyltransferase, partial [Halioglobus sp.]|nr:glycosyltransferase [Halioglobus sp.]
SGVGEIVADGESGVFVPAADPAALAGAIERLINDPSLAARLGEHARAACHEHYSAEAAIRRLESIYEQLYAR